MEILLRTFKKTEEVKEAIEEVQAEVKEKGLSIKDIKVIDRIHDSCGILMDGALIIMAE